MNKSSLPILAKALSTKCGISQTDAEGFIKSMFEVANKGLQEDKLLKMKWLGTFKVTSVKDRESIDVNTGERILIEGRDKVTFTPDNILKEIVNKPFAQFETVVVNDGVDFSEIDEKFAHMEEIEHEQDEKDAIKEKNDTSLEEASASGSYEEQCIHVFDAEITPTTEKLEEKEAAKTEDIPIPVVTDTKPSKFEKENDIKTENEPEEDIENEVEAELEEEKFTIDKHHIVLPKYLVVAASLLLVAMIGGMCWFAFNYGKMAAQRDHLALQLTTINKQSRTHIQPTTSAMVTDTTQERLKKKAIEDSIRMVKASEAVKLAETETTKQKATHKEAPKENSKVSDTEKESKIGTKNPPNASDKYDADPRIRTGAYRITGVAQTVIVKNGETLASLSKRYLGSGMECYVEALNGTTQVKAGQKLKIPQLEVKKRAK